MQADYAKSYALERKYEGGNDDDPLDTGGRTSRGITQREYNAYRSRKGLPQQDVWSASEEEIAEIYKIQYWDVIRGDDLPAGIDVVVFDGAVNSGPVQSAKWLQRAIGVDVDGHIGELTLQAVRQAPDADAVVASIIDQRDAFLRHLKSFNHFGRGWLARTANVKEVGQAWASGSVGPAPAELPHSAKADPATLPTTNPGTGVALTATTGGGSALVQQVQDAVQPLSSFQDAFQFVKYIMVAVAVLSFGYTVYCLWKNNSIAKVT